MGNRGIQVNVHTGRVLVLGLMPDLEPAEFDAIPRWRDRSNFVIGDVSRVELATRQRACEDGVISGAVCRLLSLAAQAVTHCADADFKVVAAVLSGSYGLAFMEQAANRARTNWFSR